MSAEERPVHPSALEAAEDGVETLKDAATDESGVVVHLETRTPVTMGESVERSGDRLARRE